MIFSDTSLQCFECGQTFISPADEQEFFRSKGYYYEPKRCPSCRQAKKAQRTIGLREKRQMHSAVCAKCGVKIEVPFEPRDGIPVYCDDCYSKVAQSSY